MFGFQYQLFHLYPPYREQNSLMDSLPHILFDHNNEKAIDHSNYLFYCHPTLMSHLELCDKISIL